MRWPSRRPPPWQTPPRAVRNSSKGPNGRPHLAVAPSEPHASHPRQQLVGRQRLVGVVVRRPLQEGHVHVREASSVQALEGVLREEGEEKERRKGQKGNIHSRICGRADHGSPHSSPAILVCHISPICRGLRGHSPGPAE